MKKILIPSFMILLLCSFAFWNQTPTPVKTNQVRTLYDGLDRNANSTYKNTNPIFVDGPLVLEGPKVMGAVSIGPEIPITGLTGFYDYQMNGSNSMHIYRHNATIMYACYMASPDSLNIATSRVSKIAFSSNDGTTWTDFGPYPTTKSGFPSMSGKSDGTGLMGNHYSVGYPFAATGFMNYDLLPGIGNFNGTECPPNYAWPQENRLTNGNILQMGDTYGVSAATDSIGVVAFNPTSNTFVMSTNHRLIGPTGIANQINQSLGMNTGPSGRAIILQNPYRETPGGNWGVTRIWSVQSADNGATWGSFLLEFDPHMISGDSIAPNQNGACDVIMDASGNYYWAFNSLGPSHRFVNGRLLVGKNHTDPQIVAGTHTSSIHPIPQIPDAMVAQAFIANFDHPCLALSDDGTFIFVSYSVPFQNDTLNTFNKCHIFYQYAPTATMSWSNPIQVTNSGVGSYDERYASINRVVPSSGGQYTLYMVYQKDRQPGSAAYLDNAPLSRASLIFRTITNATLVGNNNNSTTAKEFKLEQNYPNPFNPSTTINFNLPVRSEVTLKVYDVLGNEVATLVNGVKNAGANNISFDASDLASGIYFYTINAGIYTDTKKMILIK